MAALHMHRDEQAEVLLKFQQKNEEDISTDMNSAAVKVCVESVFGMLGIK